MRRPRRGALTDAERLAQWVLIPKLNVSLLVPNGWTPEAPEGANVANIVLTPARDESLLTRLSIFPMGGDVPEYAIPFRKSGATAFSGRNYLRSAPLAALGAGAFESCVWLPEIVLPDGLEVIGSSAFFACHPLCPGGRVALPWRV